MAGTQTAEDAPLVGRSRSSGLHALGARGTSTDIWQILTVVATLSIVSVVLSVARVMTDLKIPNIPA